jgi:hypothetical protein
MERKASDESRPHRDHNYGTFANARQRDQQRHCGEQHIARIENSVEPFSPPLKGGDYPAPNTVKKAVRSRSAHKIKT